MVRVIDRRKAIALYLLLRRLRKRRRIWVHPRNLRRRQHGDFHNLVNELRLDSERHRQYFRMTAEQMDNLLSLVGTDLTRQNTNYRSAIEPKQRLAVTLRYLASGDSMSSLASSYCLGIKTVADSIEMTCTAIERQMARTHLPRPTEEDWKTVAKRFWEKWNFPNCIGALGGKRVSVQASRSRSRHSNRKKPFSVVLMALVDADYRFRVVQVGDVLRTGDGEAYAGSALGRGMEAKSLHVPEDDFLPAAGHLGKMPFAMAAGAAFPLKTYLMRPYPGYGLSERKRAFNRRLSRAGTAVENAFAVLASRWRILRGRINRLPRKVGALVTAACILHNHLLAPAESQRWLDEREGSERRWGSVRSAGGDGGSRDAFSVREKFCRFFNSPEGSVPPGQDGTVQVPR